MLYLVATPIGNLADLSQRALSTLQASDLILCEDTRHSQKLLTHYQIQKPLLSFHSFNEKEREGRILKALKEGQTLSLLSDAGTPLVSDPGYELVKACIREEIPFSMIPGPCSPIAALLLSGFESEPFQFIGFLPKQSGALKKTLYRSLFYPGTTIAFERAQRVGETLALLQEMAPQREIAIARELTKTHEECLRGSVDELFLKVQQEELKGEVVLLLRKGPPPQEALDLEETVSLLQELYGLSLKEAIKMTAKLQDLPKSEVYRRIHID